MAEFRCCLNTPPPGPWKAGVNDTADPPMVNAMVRIQTGLSYSTPLREFISYLNAGVNIDSRTMLGGDLTRCMLANAAHRLTLLTEGIDPAPWRTRSQRLRDAWAIIKGRAVAIHVTGTVYDTWRERPPQEGE